MSDYELRYGGESLSLDAVDGTEEPHGLNISKLLSTTGRVTYDPGFGNTASSESAITFIDGDAGILRYRGYPIDQLAESSTFLETSYLLICGELPTAQQLADFETSIKTHTMLHEEFKSFFAGFPRDAHPMPVLASAVSALSTFYQDSLDPCDAEQVEMSTVRLLAKLPTIAAYAFKKAVGLPLLYPDNSLGYVENFLRMCFGHRVYTNFDPRSRIVKNAAAQVLEGLGKPDPLLDIAMKLEEVALNDDYFVSRKLYPNVDFYTGVIYKAMGFPTRMFTVLFALGRLPGWIAQWREMMADPTTKIGRPRQVYTGPKERSYIAVDQR